MVLLSEVIRLVIFVELISLLMRLCRSHHYIAIPCTTSQKNINSQSPFPHYSRSSSLPPQSKPLTCLTIPAPFEPMGISFYFHSSTSKTTRPATIKLAMMTLRSPSTFASLSSLSSATKLICLRLTLTSSVLFLKWTPQGTTALLSAPVQRGHTSCLVSSGTKEISHSISRWPLPLKILNKEVPYSCLIVRIIKLPISQTSKALHSERINW